MVERDVAVDVPLGVLGLDVRAETERATRHLDASGGRVRVDGRKVHALHVEAQSAVRGAHLAVHVQARTAGELGVHHDLLCARRHGVDTLRGHFEALDDAPIRRLHRVVIEANVAPAELEALDGDLGLRAGGRRLFGWRLLLGSGFFLFRRGVLFGLLPGEELLERRARLRVEDGRPGQTHLGERDTRRCRRGRIAHGNRDLAEIRVEGLPGEVDLLARRIGDLHVGDLDGAAGADSRALPRALDHAEPSQHLQVSCGPARLEPIGRTRAARSA